MGRNSENVKVWKPNVEEGTDKEPESQSVNACGQTKGSRVAGFSAVLAARGLPCHFCGLEKIESRYDRELLTWKLKKFREQIIGRYGVVLEGTDASTSDLFKFWEM